MVLAPCPGALTNRSGHRLSGKNTALKAVPTSLSPVPRPRLLPEPVGLPPVAKLWLNADEQVLACTATARRIIRANAGCLSIDHGRLRLQPDPAPLQGALRRICAPGSHQRREHTLTMHRLHAAPLTLRLSRHHDPDTGVALAVVWLADPDQLQLDEAALRQAFDFTPTEARVAEALATGSTTAELARDWGLQANTVQMHVKRMLAKTHTSRQAQLVGLLWRSALLRLPTTPPRAWGVRAGAHHGPTQTGSDDSTA